MSKSRIIIENRHLKVKLTDTAAIVYVDEHMLNVWDISNEFGKEVIGDFRGFYEEITPHLETMADYERALKYAPILWHVK